MFRCCFGHVYMLGLHVSLLFRSCIHVRATCFVVVSVMYVRATCFVVVSVMLHVRATCFVVVSVMYTC